MHKQLAIIVPGDEETFRQVGQWACKRSFSRKDKEILDIYDGIKIYQLICKTYLYVQPASENKKQ